MYLNILLGIVHYKHPKITYQCSQDKKSPTIPTGGNGYHIPGFLVYSLRNVCSYFLRFSQFRIFTLNEEDADKGHLNHANG